MPLASLRRRLPAVVVAALLLPLTACGGSGNPPRSAAVPSSAVRDPLTELADTGSPHFSDDAARPVLHASGRGPARFTVPRPGGATAVRFYVTCSPDSRFRVTMSTWFTGPCSTAFQNSGRLPLGPVDQPVTVELDLPADVDYWIVGLAVG